MGARELIHMTEAEAETERTAQSRLSSSRGRSAELDRAFSGLAFRIQGDTQPSNENPVLRYPKGWRSRRSTFPE